MLPPDWTGPGALVPASTGWIPDPLRDGDLPPAIGDPPTAIEGLPGAFGSLQGGIGPLQGGIDPVTLRLVGFGAIVLASIGLLLFLIRAGGPSDDRASGDMASGDRMPAERPAGGTARGSATGGPDDARGPGDARQADRTDEEWGAGGRPGTTGGDRSVGGGYDPPGEGGQFDHSVVGERGGELLVEVGDGRRTASFVVAEEGGTTTVEPVADPARRHGSGWVADAERYLRRRPIGTGTDEEGDAITERSGGVERRFGGDADWQSGSGTGIDREFGDGPGREDEER